MAQDGGNPALRVEHDRNGEPAFPVAVTNHHASVMHAYVPSWHDLSRIANTPSIAFQVQQPLAAAAHAALDGKNPSDGNGDKRVLVDF